MGLMEQTEEQHGQPGTSSRTALAELQLLWSPEIGLQKEPSHCCHLCNAAPSGCPALPCVPPVLHFAPCACGQQVSILKPHCTPRVGLCLQRSVQSPVKGAARGLSVIRAPLKATKAFLMFWCFFLQT